MNKRLCGRVSLSTLSTAEIMHEFLGTKERIDGRDDAPYNLSTSIGITLHSQLNNQNPRTLVTVGYTV